MRNHLAHRLRFAIHIWDVSICVKKRIVLYNYLYSIKPNCKITHTMEKNHPINITILRRPDNLRTRVPNTPNGVVRLFWQEVGKRCSSKKDKYVMTHVSNTACSYICQCCTENVTCSTKLSQTSNEDKNTKTYRY